MSELQKIFLNNIIHFQNTFNLRTVGGFRNKDNLLVKKGILFRCDNLARLNSLELHSLKILGLNKIVDFRSLNEVGKEPDKIPLNVKYINMPIESDKKVSTEIHLVLNGLLSKGMKSYLIEANKNFVLKNSDIFSKFIKEFIQSDGEITLYHCTAGKDRTGFATAMILSIIDVSRETIIEEYLFSNYCIERTLNKQLAKVCDIMDINHNDAFKIMPLMIVDIDYINEAFNTIDKIYGNIQNYIEIGLKITKAEINKLKSILLVSYR